MMYIQHGTGDNVGAFWDWHVGEPIPPVRASTDLAITVDGDEAGAFFNIPYAHSMRLVKISGPGALRLWLAFVEREVEKVKP